MSISRLFPKVTFSILFAFLAFGLSGCDKDDDDDITETDPVTDIQGNVYQTVKIGSQVWMKENLKVTVLNDGTEIPLVTDSEVWKYMTGAGYCWYDNDEAESADTYGALYNWHAVNTGKLCPTGWHVPTREEWEQMIDFLGGEDVAGGKLKDTGTMYWSAPNTGATNSSGFKGLPGGSRGGTDGIFSAMGLRAYFWTSSEDYVYTAWPKLLHYDSADMEGSFANMRSGLSVRCVKD